MYFFFYSATFLECSTDNLEYFFNYLYFHTLVLIVHTLHMWLYSTTTVEENKNTAAFKLIPQSLSLYF